MRMSVSAFRPQPQLRTRSSTLMAVPQASLWDAVLEQTKLAQERNTDPLVWAVQLASTLHSAAVSMPSVELAHCLVSHIFWENHVPIAWKFLEKASSLRIVPPLLVLALLSTRVVPNRQFHPSAYRLYMELLKRNAFVLVSHINCPNYEKIMRSIDDVLQLSQVYSQKVCEPGVVLVEFLFSIVCQLLEATLDDVGLLNHSPENKPRWLSRSHDMNIDGPDYFSENNTEQKEGLQRINTAMAVEIIAEFFQNKMTSRILSLVHRNMPSHWGSFIDQLQLLASNSLVLRNFTHITPETLLLFTSNIHEVVSHECKKSKLESNLDIAAGSHISFAGQSHGDSWSSLWLPIDLILEDAMDEGHVAAFSAIEILTGLVKALQAVNGATWHSTFLGLWVAALRLVQRERNPSEGPLPCPRLDTCLCMLLCITTLVVANIIEEEEGELIEEAERSPTNHRIDKQALGKRRGELVTSLQLLGDYEGLLTAPQSVVSEANLAAAKAIMFISRNTVSSGNFECMR